MNPRNLLLTGVIVAAGLVTVYYFVRPDAPSLSAVQVIDIKDKAAELRIGELETQLRAVQKQLELNEQARAEASPVDRNVGSPEPSAKTAMTNLELAPQSPRPTVDSTENELDALAAIEAEERQIRKARQTLDEQLASEEVDTQWSNSVMMTLKEAWTEPTFTGSQIDSIDCRSTLCRINISNRDSTSDEAFGDSYWSVPPFTQGPSFYNRIENADGSTSWTIYVARERHELSILRKRDPS